MESHREDGNSRLEAGDISRLLPPSMPSATTPLPAAAAAAAALTPTCGWKSNSEMVGSVSCFLRALLLPPLFSRCSAIAATAAAVISVECDTGTLMARPVCAKLLE